MLIKLETYPQYLKEKGIVLSRKKMEESAKFLKSIFKEKPTNNE